MGGCGGGSEDSASSGTVWGDLNLFFPLEDLFSVRDVKKGLKKNIRAVTFLNKALRSEKKEKNGGGGGGRVGRADWRR